MPDGVDSWILDGAHVAKEGALAARQFHFQFFMVQVHLVFQMISRAPFALRLEESGGKHLREDIVVVSLDANLLHRKMDGNAGIAARRSLRKERDMRLHMVTLDLLESLDKLWRPGQSGDGVVGLVAAKTQDGFAELVADNFFVLLVREAQVLLCCRRVEIILQRLRAILDTLWISVGASGRGAELMVHEQHRPASLGSDPVQCVAVQRKRNRRAVLVNR